jgi:hypothetical protein
VFTAFFHPAVGQKIERTSNLTRGYATKRGVAIAPLGVHCHPPSTVGNHLGWTVISFAAVVAPLAIHTYVTWMKNAINGSEHSKSGLLIGARGSQMMRTGKKRVKDQILHYK